MNMRSNACSLWHVWILAVAIVCSSLAVIWSTHESRALNRHLNHTHAELARAQHELRQLHLEHSTRSNHMRMEQLAVEKLHMRPPHLGNSKMIRLHKALQTP